MLISYNRPDDIAANLTGAAFLSDDAGSALFNGRPAAASRIQSAGASFTIRCTWSIPIAPRVLSLLGVTLPVGATIELAFRRPADGSYTYLADVPTQQVVKLPDGSRCAWFALAGGLDPVVGAEFRITAAAGTYDIGEAWVGVTDEYCLRRTMADQIIDPSIKRRSYGSQPFVSARLPYRALKLEFTPQPDVVLPDLRDLRAAITRNQPLAVVPIETDVQESSCFGVADPMELDAMPTGKYWTTILSMQEAPASPA